jgi:hypothetical protein
MLGSEPPPPCSDSVEAILAPMEWFGPNSSNESAKEALAVDEASPLVNEDQLPAVGVRCPSPSSALWKSPNDPKSPKESFSSKSSESVEENEKGSSPLAAESENGPNPSS